jgi:hypothetical protein
MGMKSVIAVLSTTLTDAVSVTTVVWDGTSHALAQHERHTDISVMEVIPTI